MSYTVVTVSLDQKNTIDLALPLNVPNRVLTEAISQALKLPEENIYLLAIKHNGDVIHLSPAATLAEAGVLDGALLQLEEASHLPMAAGFRQGVHLEMESGAIFPLEKDSILIGRKDLRHGVHVDIDLSSHDDKKLISRRHAAIERRGENYLLKDLGSINGTSVNGERLPAEQDHPLNDGDVIEFGRGVIRLTFVEK